MIALTKTNYNFDFICGLLKEVDDKIALVSNKDYKFNIYGMGNHSTEKYQDLLVIHNILEKILKCNTCYDDCDEFKIEDIVNLVKNKLNSYC